MVKLLWNHYLLPLNRCEKKTASSQFSQCDTAETWTQIWPRNRPTSRGGPVLTGRQSGLKWRSLRSVLDPDTEIGKKTKMGAQNRSRKHGNAELGSKDLCSSLQSDRTEHKPMQPPNLCLLSLIFCLDNCCLHAGLILPVLALTAQTPQCH